MKKCSKCQEHKDFSLFNKKGNGYQTYCRECERIRYKEYYKIPKERERLKLLKNKYRAKARHSVLEYLKNNPCVDCGETDPVVLEFDHRSREDKKDVIARMINNCGWDTILSEINKCDVRCANCHKRRTAKQFGWYKLGEE